MQDGMKANPEESLRRALAEFAGGTGTGVASEGVRRRLKREVRVRAYRRWVLAALATAAALSAILFGVTTRSAPHVMPSLPRNFPQQVSTPDNLSAPAVTVAAPLAVSPGNTRGRIKPHANSDWRKGEIELSPWYYNTALPASARTVLVHSEVDARTAMRFGVVSPGATAPVEILFGEDGLPRAMRFVRRLPTQSN